MRQIRSQRAPGSRPSALNAAGACARDPAGTGVLDLVGQLDTGDSCGCCRRGLEAVHRGTSSLDGSVVLLDDIVQVLTGSNLDVAPEGGLATQQPKRPSARNVTIERHFAGTVAKVGRHSLAEESLGRSDAAVWSEQEVDRPTLPVDSPVQVEPFAPDLHVCLVDAPGATRWLAKLSHRFSNSGTKRWTQRQIVDG